MRKVTVLLSTYNGEKYLKEQIQSLIEQEGVCVKILVRDDASTDKTQDILREYKSKGILEWYGGENIKPAYSFLDLLYRAPESDYYAFCDQDDFWIKDKLEIAINHLDRYPQEEPALYYGRARLTDQYLQPMGMNKTSADKMLDFYSALINSNAIGCTMVFNMKLANIIREKKPSYIAMHDGWVHKVCIISKGNIFFDDDVHILYRQHENNVIGGIHSKWKRIGNHYESFRKKECIRSRTICSLLECYGNKMEQEEYQICRLISEYRNSIVNRIRIIFCNKIKTNYFRRNLLFKIAIILKIF
ncbi:MAG: glycosyltransferase family 2 protein [Lachnospiraceae bacterium]|nr:glycosyltransferase family 2 protein [Lachnospiraceae bacterium]